jgi:hypothetical protein
MKGEKFIKDGFKGQGTEAKFNSTGTQGTGGTAKPVHTTKHGKIFYGSRKMC